MAKQRVLIIGHSFVHRLKAFVQKKRHIQAFSSLSGIADIYFHRVGGRTIAKFRKFNFHACGAPTGPRCDYFGARLQRSGGALAPDSGFTTGKFSLGTVRD